MLENDIKFTHRNFRRYMHTGIPGPGFPADPFAGPTVYIIANRGLQGLAFRFDIGNGTFMWAGLAAPCISAAAVGRQILRTPLPDRMTAVRGEHNAMGFRQCSIIT